MGEFEVAAGDEKAIDRAFEAAAKNGGYFE